MLSRQSHVVGSCFGWCKALGRNNQLIPIASLLNPAANYCLSFSNGFSRTTQRIRISRIEKAKAHFECFIQNLLGFFFVNLQAKCHCAQTQGRNL